MLLATLTLFQQPRNSGSKGDTALSLTARLHSSLHRRGIIVYCGLPHHTLLALYRQITNALPCLNRKYQGKENARVSKTNVEEIRVHKKTSRLVPLANATEARSGDHRSVRAVIYTFRLVMNVKKGPALFFFFFFSAAMYKTASLDGDFEWLNQSYRGTTQRSRRLATQHLSIYC